MLHTQEDILTWAMALPPDDRALVDRLFNSLDSPQRKEINQELFAPTPLHKGSMRRIL